MIRAKTANGWFLLGLTEENMKRLQEGEPIKIDLSDHGGKDTVIIFYGKTSKELLEFLEEISGAPLPPAQPYKPGGFNA